MIFNTCGFKKLYSVSFQENLEPELFETAIPYDAAQWNPDDPRQAHGRNTSRNVDLSTCVNPLIEAEIMEDANLVFVDQGNFLYHENHI